ncbi:hypothetical protein H8959_004253, partial [Pygathrix nigripes]
YDSMIEKEELIPKQEISEELESQRAKSEDHVRNIFKETEEMNKTEGKLENRWRKYAVEGVKNSFSQKNNFRTITMRCVKTLSRENGHKFNAVGENCITDLNLDKHVRVCIEKSLHPKKVVEILALPSVMESGWVFLCLGPFKMFLFCDKEYGTLSFRSIIFQHQIIHREEKHDYKQKLLRNKVSLCVD